MFFLSGTEIRALAFTEHLNCMPHLAGYIYHSILTIASARWISCLPSQTSLVSELLTQRHGAMMWWSWSVETETSAWHNGGWTHWALIWTANLSWREALVSFCGASLFQLAVVFPLKLWQAMNSRENVTKTGCGTNGQSLWEFPPWGTTSQAQGSIGLLLSWTKHHFILKDPANVSFVVCVFCFVF